MKKHLGRNPFDRQKDRTCNPSLPESNSEESSDSTGVHSPPREQPRKAGYDLLVNLSTRSIVFALKAAMVVRTVIKPPQKDETEIKSD